MTKIEEVVKSFDLFMIVEQFDESLVLMRQTVCWEFEDLTSLKLNGRKEGTKQTMNEYTRENLKIYHMPYNNFFRIFRGIIKRVGTRENWFRTKTVIRDLH